MLRRRTSPRRAPPPPPRAQRCGARQSSSSAGHFAPAQQSASSTAAVSATATARARGAPRGSCDTCSIARARSCRPSSRRSTTHYGRCLRRGAAACLSARRMMPPPIRRLTEGCSRWPPMVLAPCGGRRGRAPRRAVYDAIAELRFRPDGGAAPAPAPRSCPAALRALEPLILIV